LGTVDEIKIESIIANKKDNDFILLPMFQSDPVSLEYV